MRSGGFSVENYLVCYLDLMGTSARFAAMQEQYGSADKAARMRHVAETLVPASAFRDSVRTLFELWRKPSLTPPSEFTPELAEEFRRVASADFRFHVFGDTAIAFVPIRDREGRTAHKALGGVFASASILVREMIWQGLPVRGSIEVGLGSDFFEGECYGPVLAAAAGLEKQAAWPRVLVGPQAVEFMGWLSKQSGDDFEAMASRDTGMECAGWCSRHEDGHAMLDIWGERAKQSIEDAALQTARSRFSFTLDWAREQAQVQADERVKQKYGSLVAYLESRAHLWQATA